MLVGIVAGIATCALWGLTFVAPRAVAPVPAIDLVIVRYVIFGIISAALMLHPRLRPIGIGPGRFATGLMLGAFGYVAYFAAVAMAVEKAGPALPPLVIGVMPVLLALLGNLREKLLPWRALVLPLTSMAAGLLVVDVAAFRAAPLGHGPTIAVGLLSAVTALGLWTIYGLVNSAIMRSIHAPDAFVWTGIQGLGAGCAALLLLPVSSLGDLRHASSDVLTVFFVWAALMGIAASYLAGVLWTMASRRLPLTLAGQLVIAETVFGLLFGFLFESRWPSEAEWFGGGLQILGVSAAIGAFARSSGATTGADGLQPAERPSTRPSRV